MIYVLFLMGNGVFGVQKLIVSFHLVMTELHETSASCKAHSCSVVEEEYLLLCLQESTTGFSLSARSVHSMHTHTYPMFHDPLYAPFLLASNINSECLSHDYMSTICHIYITFINLITLIWSVVYKACTHLYSFIIADHYQNQFALIVPKLQKFGLVSRKDSSYSFSSLPSTIYCFAFCA